MNCPECNRPLEEGLGDLYICPGGCWPVGISLYDLQELEEEAAEMKAYRGWVV